MLFDELWPCEPLRTNVLNKYLFLAFSALWVLFFIYAWSLSRRQARLQKELDELKSKEGVRSQDSEVRSPK